MTDNEIIKALECCQKVKGYRHIPICNDCPMEETRCAIELPKNALALINRQKAEIEFHRKTIAQNAQTALNVTLDEIQKARAEAVKEFAERLKDRTGYIPQHHFTYAEVEYHIDNLVKEFTEGEGK